MNNIEKIKALFKEHSNPTKNNHHRFFKTEIGSYGEHDRFLGIDVPKIRSMAREHKLLSLDEISILLYSPYNEERLLALIILTMQYKTSAKNEKEEIYNFFIKHIEQVNNWNLVDSCAHLIIGAHLENKDKSLLFDLAKSDNLWKRRISIVATWWMIKQSKLEDTLAIAKLLLNDKQDLIHKATGWMLREVGKKNENTLLDFLNLNAAQMPRTMLRYSLEKMPDNLRRFYMKLE